jgi:hypothetical protein
MTYRLTAVPGLFGLAALGVAIAGPVKARGNHYWPVFVLAGAGGALAYKTTLFGHPEDLLATALAVGAVMVARQGRVNLATAMLIGAIVSKQWAVLAILPAAMAAPRAGVRIAVLASLGTALLILLQTQEGSAAHGSITSTGRRRGCPVHWLVRAFRGFGAADAFARSGDPHSTRPIAS